MKKLKEFYIHEGCVQENFKKYRVLHFYTKYLGDIKSSFKKEQPHRLKSFLQARKNSHYSSRTEIYCIDSFLFDLIKKMKYIVHTTLVF